ncbi:LuxR C-terminal-related transcriptional regulator [Paenochrobactrum glaciei]|uniref:LuxR C-terminal-related transcriptional regulator n=1 Tax=Paenochrobactrum glaciei TaxID=486407 RepID=A0ABN1G9T7_9HYPH
MNYSDLSDDQLMEIAFQEAPIAVLILSNRQIKACNKEVLELFGWPVNELVGQSVRVLYPSKFDYDATGERWLRWLKSRPRYADERFMQYRGGEVFWARARGRTLTPEKPFELMVWTFERLTAEASPASDLTPREREVAQHIVNGSSSKDIGVMLGISHRTVEVHRAAVMRKLNASNTAQLISKIFVRDADH